MDKYDVIIVGGGPAGLNAAVVLGRCLRKVLLFDTSMHRNRKSHGIHNYLTRDDIVPASFLEIARQEIKKYKVKHSKREVVNIIKTKNNHFKVLDKQGTYYISKKLLIATGLRDTLPEVEGIVEMYGKSVFHCPYCDGWEVRNKKIGIYARSKNGVPLALSLKTWSRQVALFTDGKRGIKKDDKEKLRKNNIPVVTTPIKKLKGRNGKLERIVLINNESHLCDTIFFVNSYEQKCNLVNNLGCNMNDKGVVITDNMQESNIKGLYVAGDASRDMHFVVVAAAEGAKAGVAINKDLQREEQTSLF
jgi:thioredoxin reductase